MENKPFFIEELQTAESDLAPKTRQINQPRTAPIPSTALTAITPSPALGEVREFTKVKQGTGVNFISKVGSVGSKNAKIDPVTGTATFSDKSGVFSMEITEYIKMAGLRASTFQLFYAFNNRLTLSNGNDPTVTLSLSEYMEMKNISDRKEARAQVKADLEALRGMSFSWSEKRDGEVKNYRFINLADSGELSRNGIITFTFGKTFHEILRGYPIMPYPSLLWRLDTNYYKNSFYLLQKIAEHKNMNRYKDNADVIAVKTLLEVCPYIPSYEEVQSSDRHFTKRIINPFEKNMDALEEVLTWHYTHRNGVLITDEELAKMSYSEWVQYMVKITWKNYPEPPAEQLPKPAKSTKKRGRPKKKKEPEA